MTAATKSWLIDQMDKYRLIMMNLARVLRIDNANRQIVVLNLCQKNRLQ